MSLLDRLFGTPDPREALRPLWHRAVEISREREWYADCGAADTVPGRFDMVTAVLSLIILRMEKDGDLARDTAYLTELFVEDMEAQLRESGVGDPVVSKHMGKLVGALGGRLDAYLGAVMGGIGPMTEAVSRNVTLIEGAAPEPLARRLLDLHQVLVGTEDEAIVAGRIER